MVPLTLYWSPDFLNHRVSPGHPESPSRLEAVRKGLEAAGQWESLVREEARPAELDELLAVHPQGYLLRLEEAAGNGPATIDSPDTELSPGSWIAALKVAGAGFQAVDAVIGGASRTAFILGRPPGHHALPAQAMGFCLLANVALAVEYARHRHGLERVAVIDWDVHHGNGTQEIFYGSDQVFYISLHEWPLFPGTGAAEEKGTGRGRGFTLNFPLAAGNGDSDYLGILEGPIAEALLNFRPELIFISAGFDAHENDPLGHMNITTGGFGDLSRCVRKLAAEVCSGRIVSFLEGGYHLGGLADSVAVHLEVLASGPS